MVNMDKRFFLKESSVKVFSAHLDNLNKLYVNQLHMLLSTEPADYKGFAHDDRQSN
jgi:hypothetical protein